MAKDLIISFLAALFLSTVSPRMSADEPKKAKPLMEGFALSSIDGKLTGHNGNSKWLFEFDSDVSDDKGIVKAGTGIELLPSATLEKMTADVKKRTGSGYRLWGRATKYKGRNFIFPDYFLPLSKTNRPDSPPPQKAQSKLAINEPNDALTIPEEVIAKLATRRIVQPAGLLKGLESKQNFILVDRTGFLRDPGPGQEVSFVLDAIGRNAPKISFRLLPCKVLEQLQRAQSAEPDTLRFKIGGIVTQYKGRYYLLLQRAARVYSHGNFGR